jgi:hypothetical protein
VDSVTIADTVTIRPGQIRGTPAWIMTQLLHRTRGRGAGRLDSLYLSAGDLRPLRSALFWARPDRLDSAMVMDFDGGKLRWNYRVPGGAGRDTTVIMRLPDQYYTIWTEMMPFLLNGLRLSDEWSGAVPMLMPTIGRVHSDSLAPVFWVDLRVRKRERVTVPAGTFECWRVTLSFPPKGDAVDIFWIDTRTGILVKRAPADFPHTGRELVAILP